MELPIAQPNCAALLKVLADETRLAVMQQLIDGPKHVGEINEPLQIERHDGGGSHVL